MGIYLLTYYTVAVGVMCVLGLFALTIGILQNQAAKGHPAAILTNVALLALLTLGFIGICIADFWEHETLWHRTLHVLTVVVGAAKFVEEWRKARHFFRGRRQVPAAAPGQL